MTIGTSSQTDFVDMDKMVNSITREINSFWSAYESAKENTLFQVHKVPEHIREVDRKIYEPIVLSIGPYHHGSQSLIFMEKEKWKSLDYILKLNCEVSLQDYIRAISKLEKQARNCYSEDISMGRKKFLQMLLLDACFILVKVDGTVLSIRRVENQSTGGKMQEKFVGNVEDIGGQSSQSVKSHTTKHAHATDTLIPEIELTTIHDNVDGDNGGTHNDYRKPDGCDVTGDWYANSAWHDLFLLENQIPFFIIEVVYKLVTTNVLTMPVLGDRIVDCVEDILRQFPSGIIESNRPKSFHHLLHLCHMFFRPTQKFVEINENQPNVRYFHHVIHLGQKYFNTGPRTAESVHLLPILREKRFQDGQLPSRWRQAVQYQESGIQLMKREYDCNSKHSLLDIRFNYGVVEIPCFAIDENTESLFKNLLALEQTDPQFGNDVTAYVVFMSQLAMTPADAELLTKRGIIIHMLDSDEEVSSLFVRLTKDISFNISRGNYMRILLWTLENHYQNRVNRWIAWLWHTHFSNPGLALAVLAAVVVLLCTIVQTWVTVLAYVRPPK